MFNFTETSYLEDIEKDLEYKKISLQQWDNNLNEYGNFKVGNSYQKMNEILTKTNITTLIKLIDDILKSVTEGKNILESNENEFKQFKIKLDENVKSLNEQYDKMNSVVDWFEILAEIEKKKFERLKIKIDLERNAKDLELRLKNLDTEIEKLEKQNPDLIK